MDASGALYVTGTTNSTDFPVSEEAFQTVKAGEFLPDAFVVKITP